MLSETVRVPLKGPPGATFGTCARGCRNSPRATERAAECHFWHVCPRLPTSTYNWLYNVSQKELTPTFKGIIIFKPGKQMTKINFYYEV